MSYEYKAKVTTSMSFTEKEISSWLDDIATKGWRLMTATFFGQGLLWIFERERTFDAAESPEDLTKNPED